MSPIELRPVRPRADDDAPEHRERLLRRMWRVLEGRRALVTCGASGIGAACARAFTQGDGARDGDASGDQERL